MIPSARRRRAVFSLLDGVYDAGGNVFETAAFYQFGGSESVLGQWMASRKLRHRVTLITKGGHPSLIGRVRLDASSTAHDLHGSLRRLGTDHVDVYLLHRDDPSVPAESLVETLESFRESGKILSYGVSNWTHRRIAEAQSVAVDQGWQGIRYSSPHFSLPAWQREPWPGCVSIAGDAHTEARAWYTESGLPVLAWSSLAAGFVTGRFKSSDRPSWIRRSYWDNVAIRTYCWPENFRRLERLNQLADERGVSASQLAVAYLMNQNFPVYPIVSTSSAARFSELAKASQIELTASELAWLDLRVDSR